MLHKNFITYQTQIKSNQGETQGQNIPDLSDIINEELNANGGVKETQGLVGNGPLSKKEKRLMKQQRQKDQSKKQKNLSDSEAESDEEVKNHDEDMGEDQIKADDHEIEEEEAIDDEESKDDSDDPIKSIKAFKKLVISILEENQMQDKRACKMEIMDFLNLLKIFNEKGIHFK